MKDGETSSLSSLEDSDILTDRMGFEYFDLQKQKAMAHEGVVASLQPVQERLSEDTLEDVRAFCDITRTTGSVSSRANSTAGGDVGSVLLETLDECDDEEDAAIHIANLDHDIGQDETGTAESMLNELPSEEKAYFYTDDDLPAPLRFNAVRVPDRLAMSASSFFPSNTPPISTLSPGASPLPPAHRRKPLAEDIMAALKKGGSIDLSSANSSLGDLDLLTDRMAFQELDKDQRPKLDLSGTSLQPVNERLSEDTLEDCRAFTDVLRGSGGSVTSRSGANSIATGGDAASVLETLAEEDEDDDDDDNMISGTNGNVDAIHISNLENLSIELHHEDEMKRSDVSQTATLGTS